jgi:phosphoglycolate phosphatase-like HAD superfamily hydrolase
LVWPEQKDKYYKIFKVVQQNHQALDKENFQIIAKCMKTARMKTPRLRAAFFDIDGTLTIPRDLLSSRALQLALKQGYDLPDIDLNSLKREGLTSREAIVGLATQHGIEQAAAEAGADWVITLRDVHYGNLVAADKEKHRLLPVGWAVQFVIWLNDNNIHLGLMTGNSEFVARTKLFRAGYDPTLFAVGAFGDKPGRREDLAAEAIDKMRIFLPSLEVQEVLIVGDAPQDIRAGQAIGCRTLAVASGSFSAVELAETDPSLLVDDLHLTPALMHGVMFGTTETR